MPKIKKKPPLRRRSSGGYSKGDDTRSTIIRAATGVFAREGYGRASTRSIAKTASVNAASLQYYFETKAGLFHVCLEEIVTRIAARLDPVFASVAAELESADVERLIECYCHVGDELIESFFAPDEGVILAALAKTSAVIDRPESWNLMRDRIVAPLLETTRAIFIRLLRTSQDDLAAEAHAQALSGIAGIFYHDRVQAGGSLLPIAPSREYIDIIKRVVRMQHDILLRGLYQQVAVAKASVKKRKRIPKEA